MRDVENGGKDIVKPASQLQRLSIPTFAKYVVKQQDSWAQNPTKSQEKIFNDLIRVGSSTVFGKDHGFDIIHTYEDFKKAVPVRDYEGLKPYI